MNGQKTKDGNDPGGYLRLSMAIRPAMNLKRATKDQLIKGGGVSSPRHIVEQNSVAQNHKPC